jgi:hypothetical protein
VALVKYITFSIGDAGDPRLGVVHGDRVIDVRAIDQGAPTRLFDLIRDGRPAMWRPARPTALASPARRPNFSRTETSCETEVEGIGMIRNRIVAHG